MRRLGATILAMSLSACVADDSALALAADGFGLRKPQAGVYPRTRAEIDAYPYAQLGIRLGDNRPGIMVLAEYVPGGYRWLSGDGFALTTATSGRVVGMEGVEPGFALLAVEPIDPLATVDLQSSSTVTQRYSKRVRVDGADTARELTLDCALTLDADETVQIAGTSVPTHRYQETCRSDADGGGAVSWYWIGVADSVNWRSRQVPAPGLAALTVDMLKPPN